MSTVIENFQKRKERRNEPNFTQLVNRETSLDMSMVWYIRGHNLLFIWNVGIWSSLRSIIMSVIYSTYWMIRPLQASSYLNSELCYSISTTFIPILQRTLLSLREVNKTCSRKANSCIGLECSWVWLLSDYNARALKDLLTGFIVWDLILFSAHWKDTLSSKDLAISLGF